MLSWRRKQNCKKFRTINFDQKGWLEPLAQVSYKQAILCKAHMSNVLHGIHPCFLAWDTMDPLRSHGMRHNGSTPQSRHETQWIHSAVTAWDTMDPLRSHGIGHNGSTPQSRHETQWIHSAVTAWDTMDPLRSHGIGHNGSTPGNQCEMHQIDPQLPII